MKTTTRQRPPLSPWEQGGRGGEVLPLPGAVYQQRNTCGKPNCRCKRGVMHGAYSYRVWYQNGVRRKEYIHPADLPAVLSACAAYREEKRRLRAGKQLLKTSNRMFRESAL